MKKVYFILSPFVYLVKGAKRGALYNLQNGEVYSINERGCNIIEMIEKGFTLQEIHSENPDININKIYSYLKKLENNHLGKFSNEKGYSKKIELRPPSNPLHFVWLEITEQCNLKCLHCYTSSSAELTNNNTLLSLEQWKKIIKEVYQLGCRSLQFIGGEPLLFGKKKLINLIEEAKNLNYQTLELFTNCTLLDDDFIYLLKENNVSVATSFYGPKPAIHDFITRRKGSFYKTKNNIIKLLSAGINVRVGIIAMNANKNYIEETISFLSQIGVKNIKVDRVRPAGRGANESICSSYNELIFKKPFFPKITFNFFNKAHFGHNCFMDKLCVNSKGEVLPCIMERDIIFGQIQNKSIGEIISEEKVKRIRNLTKDQIDKCRDCEFRYCCFDCRIMAINFSNNHNLYAPAICSYNPYKGKFENFIKKGGDKYEIRTKESNPTSQKILMLP